VYSHVSISKGMSSYKLTTPAANDYVDILAYTLDKWGLEQYEKYQKILAATFQKVADMPALGGKTMLEPLKLFTDTIQVPTSCSTAGLRPMWRF
jgi:plasmid stabilization system protein ParE